MGFKINALREIIKTLGKEEPSLKKLREAFLSFKCSKNIDEEDFFHNKAIEYEIHNKARTYLLMNEKNDIVGYFSLAFKSIDLEDVNNSLKKRMVGGKSTSATYSAFLIGHIAKEDSVQERLGDIIINAAENLLLEAQKIVGGRLVYLDCKDESKLKELYERNDYTYFNTSKQTGLLQYFKKL